MNVDCEGVLNLIQVIQYWYELYAFRALSFDGAEIFVDAESIMDFMEKQPTTLQYLQAQRDAERMWRHLRGTEAESDG